MRSASERLALVNETLDASTAELLDVSTRAAAASDRVMALEQEVGSANARDASQQAVSLLETARATLQRLAARRQLLVKRIREAEVQAASLARDLK